MLMTWQNVDFTKTGIYLQLIYTATWDILTKPPKIKIFVTKCISSWRHKERYCGFINFRWIPIFVDFVVKFFHENKCSLKCDFYWHFVLIGSMVTNLRIHKTDFHFIHENLYSYLCNSIVISCGWPEQNVFINNPWRCLQSLCTATWVAWKNCL